MSFHDNLKFDINNTFMNNEHYSVDGLYYYNSINYDNTSNTPIETQFVFYPLTISRSNSEFRDNVIGDYKIFIKEEVETDDIDNPIFINVEVGDYVSIDNVKYTIIKINDDAFGVFECECIKFESKVGVNNKNIKYFRS
jgi:hypothetical protein